MGINKVEFGGEVLMDLTKDSVSPNVLMEGFTAHDMAGNPIVGVIPDKTGEVLERLDDLEKNKVNVIDIVDDLDTNDSERPLSANQGYVISQMLDSLFQADDDTIEELDRLLTFVNSNKSSIQQLTARLNALADSDDTTLDQLSEIVTYIKSNKSLIDNITVSKVSVSDIVDNLSSTATNKPLSANQGHEIGVRLNAAETNIDKKVDKISGKGLSTNDYTTAEKNKLTGIASGAEVNVQPDWNVTDTNSDAYVKNKPTSLPASDVYSWAKQPNKPSYSKSEVGLGNAENTSDANKNVNSALYLRSRGNVAAETGTTLPAVAGLSMSQIYNNGYPITYGNMLTLNGGGKSELLLGWSGSNGGIAGVYYRNKRDVADAEWSDFKQLAFMDSTVAAATKAIQDGNGAVIPDTYMKIADYNSKKSYIVKLESYPNTNFYFVSFPNTDSEIDCEIHSPNLGGNAPYNQNILHFLLVSQGWADTPKSLFILNHSVYDVAEITIMSIVIGAHSGVNGVYLRGGLNYKIFCNFAPTLRTSQYTNGSEIFQSGNTTCYNSGFTNASVLIDFTVDVNKRKYALYDGQIRSKTMLITGGGTTNDERNIEITKESVTCHMPTSAGFAGGFVYDKNGVIVGEIGYMSDGYYYIGQAYNNANGRLKLGELDFGTVSGTIKRGLKGIVGSSDGWRIIGGATGDNAGYLEISTDDDGSEPIYVRQYSGGGPGSFTTLVRTATLLDGNGNTTFPGIVTAPYFNGKAKHADNDVIGGYCDTLLDVINTVMARDDVVRFSSGNLKISTKISTKMNDSGWYEYIAMWQNPRHQNDYDIGLYLFLFHAGWNVNAQGNCIMMYINGMNGTYNVSREECIDALWRGMPFGFGIDANGNYGYKKLGADTVTPFLKPTSLQTSSHYINNPNTTLSMTSFPGYTGSPNVKYYFLFRSRETSETYNVKPYVGYLDSSGAFKTAVLTYVNVNSINDSNLLNVYRFLGSDCLVYSYTPSAIIKMCILYGQVGPYHVNHGIIYISNNNQIFCI